MRGGKDSSAVWRTCPYPNGGGMQTSAQGHTAVKAVGGFYEAFLEGGEPTVALSQLTKLVPCEHAVLGTLATGHWQWSASSGLAAIEQVSMDQICQTFFSDLVGSQPADAFVRTSDVVNLQELKSSDFYQAHLRPLGGGRSLMVHGQVDGEPIAVAFCRSLEGDSDFDVADKKMAEVVWPHIKRVQRLQRGHSVPSARPPKTFDAIDALSTALLGLDACGQVVHVNQRAVAMLRDCSALSVRSGRLVASRPHDDTRLRNVLAAALASPYRAGAVVLPAGNAAGRASDRTAVVVLQVRPSQQVEGSYGRDDVAAWVMCRDDRETRISVEPLRVAFGLTQREAEVASRLCMGRILSEIAVELGIAPDSVRQHLKAAFSKTHTRGQSELVSLLLRTLG